MGHSTAPGAPLPANVLAGHKTIGFVYGRILISRAAVGGSCLFCSPIGYIRAPLLHLPHAHGCLLRCYPERQAFSHAAHAAFARSWAPAPFHPKRPCHPGPTGGSCRPRRSVGSLPLWTSPPSSPPPHPGPAAAPAEPNRGIHGVTAREGKGNLPPGSTTRARQREGGRARAEEGGG